MKLGNKDREHQSLLSETNNNEEKSENIKLKSLDLVQGKINNTERGKPPPVTDKDSKVGTPAKHLQNKMSNYHPAACVMK